VQKVTDGMRVRLPGAGGPAGMGGPAGKGAG
jgi:hypothetical protein